jgi:hypothetical protein
MLDIMDFSEHHYLVLAAVLIFMVATRLLTRHLQRVIRSSRAKESARLQSGQ